MIAKHKNVRILLSLLKQYDIRHFVISPGSRNMPLVRSIEDDPYFTCFSVVDERSAAYFAVGMTLELKAPVAITSTSGQATRNYFPGMTEAFYRKAPLLVVTADYDENFTGQLNMQSVRQMDVPKDAAKVSFDIPIVKDRNDHNLVTRRLNEALDALRSHGGGPAHVNLRIDKHWERGEDQLEEARRITRHFITDEDWPRVGRKKVMVLVGQHHPFSELERDALDRFSDSHDCVVYVNHISNCHGARAVHGNLLLSTGPFERVRPDLVISIGGHLGDYPVDGCLRRNDIEHWRVGPDGQLADAYNSLTRVFECEEYLFFERMARESADTGSTSYHDRWCEAIQGLQMPSDFPLTHALVAQCLSPALPKGSNIHFGILSSLRFWEFFSLDPSVRCYSNVAGFGIDGDLSTFLGQSAVSDRLNFLVVGDLAFFYDMNSLGIRQLGRNVRIVLINNHGGGEFRINTHSADLFGDSSNRHIAAGGHFGESAEGWVKNNGFDYIGVRQKSELAPAIQRIVRPADRPVVVEVFTEMKRDANALQAIIDANDSTPKSKKFAQAIKGSIPHEMKTGIKKFMNKQSGHADG